MAKRFIRVHIEETSGSVVITVEGSTEDSWFDDLTEYLDIVDSDEEIHIGDRVNLDKYR